MMKKLLDVNGDVAVGISPDVHAENQIAWEFSANVHSTPQGIRKQNGWRKVKDTDLGISTGMEQMQEATGNTKHILIGTRAGMWRYDGSSLFDAKRTAGYNGVDVGLPGTRATMWSFVEWGNWIVATNGVDPMQLYRHGTDAGFRDLDDATGYNADDPPITAQIVRKLGPHVIAFNTDEGINAYEWCETDDLSVWTPTSTNGAGGNVVRDFDSEIVAVEPLGDKLAIYGLDRMSLMSYLGPPFYFGVLNGLRTLGAEGKWGIVSEGRRNFGLCRRGIFVTDGVQSKYLDEGFVRKEVLDDIAWDHASKIVGFHNATRGEVGWFYPSLTSGGRNDKGVTYNYNKGAWQLLNYGRDAALDQRIFPNSYGMQGGYLVQDSDNWDADSEPLDAFIQSGPMAFADERGKSFVEYIKYVESIRLKMIDVRGLVKVKVGYKMDLDLPWQWWEGVVPGNSMEPVYPKVSGRWFCLRVESNEKGASWELQGFTVYGTLVGGRPR